MEILSDNMGYFGSLINMDIIFEDLYTCWINSDKLFRY